MRTRREWYALLERFEAAAKHERDPKHRRWCRGQLTVIRRKMVRLRLLDPER